jgi:hypothetical protein
VPEIEVEGRVRADETPALREGDKHLAEQDEPLVAA